MFSIMFHGAEAETEKPTNKLTVIIVPLSTGSPKRGWQTPDYEYISNTYKAVYKHLSRTGIYEIIPNERVEAFAKENKVKDSDWQKDNWALLRKAGKALGADYAFLRERGFVTSFYSSMILINIDSGKTFEYQDYIKSQYGSTPMDAKIIVRESFREIFKNAKADLLATAVRKMKSTADTEGIKQETASVQKKEIKKPAEGIKVRIPPDKKEAEPASSKKDSKKPLIIYDFITNEQLKVISLLLAEALREELSARFNIISREEAIKAIEEMKLQQSGMTEEKNMINIGKWVSAKEAISGTFGLMGKTYILKAKRLDMETLEAISFGSIKTELGREEELLNELPSLATSLSAIR